MNNFINYVAATMIATSFTCNSHAEELPSPESLFARHVEVSYGKGGLTKHSSMTITTETLMKEYGVTVPAIEKRKAPGYRYSEGEAMGIRTAGGCDLSFCWEEGMRGPEIIEGNELQRWLEHADYYRWENMDKYAKSMATISLEKWNGEETYRVKVIDKFDKENFYFFSKDTGFMICSELTIADMEGFTTRSSIYSDFKKFGPFTLPATTTEFLPSLTRISNVVDITFEEIADATFETPDNIKQLMSQE